VTAQVGQAMKQVSPNALHLVTSEPKRADLLRRNAIERVLVELGQPVYAGERTEIMNIRAQARLKEIVNE